MVWLEKLFDPTTWKTVQPLYGQQPLLLVHLVLAGLVGWMFHKFVTKSHVNALNTRIETLKEGKADLETRLSQARDDLGHAREEQTGIARELDLLKAENSKQAAAIHVQQLKIEDFLKGSAAQQPASQITVQQFVNVFSSQLGAVRNSTTAIAERLNVVTNANNQFGTSLSNITGILNVPPPPLLKSST